MTSKIISGEKSFTYEYNLQNKLKVVTMVTASGDGEITEYVYDDGGTRVKSRTWNTTGGTPATPTTLVIPGTPVAGSKKVTYFLADPYNHTGYSQVLEEIVYEGLNSTDPDPNPLTDTPTSQKTYTIGDDVISQHKTATDYLLYDGHGSTRQLADSSGAITEAYSYDGYGVLLGGNPTRSNLAATSLLYTGEYYDNDMTQYNLRARWYDTLNGRFNQLDPYAGNNQDPQSLHKYLYCHANPVNGIDPSGEEFSICSVMTSVAILGVMTGILNVAVTGVALTYAGASNNTLPDAGVASVSLVGGTSGVLGEVGFDIVWERKTRKLYAFVYADLGLSPITYFKTFRGKQPISVAIGAIWNLNRIGDWSGVGMTATWPLKGFRLISRAMLNLSGGKMWGALTQLAKREHNVKANNMTVQFQFSSSGPAAMKVAFRSNQFSCTGGLTSSPLDLASIGVSLGDMLGPLSNKLQELPRVCDDFASAVDLVQ